MQWHFGRHFYRTPFRHDDVGCKRGLREKRTRDRDVILTQRRGSIRPRAPKAQFHDVATIIGPRRAAAGAEAARCTAQDDVVADRQATNRGATRFHDPSTFVSEHDGHGNRNAASTVAVDIGMTDSRGDDSHTHLVNPGVLELQLLDPWMWLSCPRYGCLNFHDGSSSCRGDGSASINRPIVHITRAADHARDFTDPTARPPQCGGGARRHRPAARGTPEQVRTPHFAFDS